jgi:hypothetical protein
MDNDRGDRQMNKFLVQNEFGVWVVDIFALWLSTHKLGEIDNPNPIHNDVAVDIFLIGVSNE